MVWVVVVVVVVVVVGQRLCFWKWSNLQQRRRMAAIGGWHQRFNFGKPFQWPFSTAGHCRPQSVFPLMMASITGIHSHLKCSLLLLLQIGVWCMALTWFTSNGIVRLYRNCSLVRPPPSTISQRPLQKQRKSALIGISPAGAYPKTWPRFWPK